MAIYEPIRTQEKVDFVRNLSLLVRSGTPINEAFSLLAAQTRSKIMRNSLVEAKDKIEQGSSIHAVFEENKHFDNVFVSFIRAGEESGTLDENLNFLGDWLERQNTLQKEMSSATLYPKIIVTFAVVLGGVLSVVVLPRLIPIFNTLDVELPWTTRLLLWFSNLVQERAIMLLLAFAVIVAVLYALSKLNPVRRLLDKIYLKIPVFGSLFREYQLTIISQLTATLFKSGLTIKQTLDIVGDSVTNTQYEDSLLAVKDRVEGGTNFSGAMGEFPNLYPAMFTSVVASGEKSGSFSEAFAYLADFFAGKVTERTKKLPTVIEPVLLITIGVFVAFIASAIILPIYEVTKGLY